MSSSFSLKKRLLCIFLLICSFNANNIYCDHTKHPLWVGYGSSKDGRTPRLSGVINKELISLYLPSNPIIVEAGAYDGNDTSQMARMWPDAQIYAFEPMPYAYKLLKQNCSSFSNVQLFRMALSDKTGWKKFYISAGESLGSSSLLPPGTAMEEYHNNISFDEVINVSSITLDDWAKLYNIDHIDFLWLDMQGFEPFMLKASPKILERIKVIFTEINLSPLYDGAILYSEYKSWLESKGFELVREDIPWIDGGDALFVRKQ